MIYSYKRGGGGLKNTITSLGKGFQFVDLKSEIVILLYYNASAVSNLAADVFAGGCNEWWRWYILRIIPCNCMPYESRTADWYKWVN